MPFEERLAASGHVAIEVLDVRAIEFDDVDIDEGYVLAVLAHALARGDAEALEIVGKIAGLQGPGERVAAALGDLPILVEQRAENRFLVGKVMIDVTDRDSCSLRNLTNGRATVSLV